MSSSKETMAEQPETPKHTEDGFSAPNGEYVPALAIGKLLHLPGFEDEPASDPTDHLSNAS